MQLAEAVDRVLLGESLRGIAAAYRAELLEDLGLDPEQARPETFRRETHQFMGKLCRELADRHPGDTRAGAALREWVRRVDDYDAFDALLTAFGSFDGRETVVRRGRRLFAGPLTAHWEET